MRNETTQTGAMGVSRESATTIQRVAGGGAAFAALLRIAQAGVVLLALGAIGSAQAAAPDPQPDGDVLFSLERARRAQQREGTAASPYRSNIPWPVGATDSDPARWAIATVGAEYDEQPILLSNGIGPLDEMSSDGRAAGAWFVDLGAELFRRGEFSGGLAGSYWGQDWSDWDRFTNYPTVAAWLDWNWDDRWAMRLRYDLGYASVDWDGFATTHHVGPRFYRDWSDNGVSEVWAEYYDFDFHKDPTNYPQTPTAGGPGAACNFPGGPIATPCAPNQDRTLAERRDRSGWGFLFGGEHRVRIDFNDTEVRGGYTYEHFIPEGAEFHNQVHEVWIGATTPLPLGFVLDSNVTYLFQMTRNPSSFAVPDSLAANRIYEQEDERRFDHVVRVYTAIGRQITSHVSASVEYGFTNHDSNLESFDYARHRVGGYLTVHFD